MMRDITTNSMRIKSEAIVGDMLLFGARLGLPTPVPPVAYCSPSGIRTATNRIVRMMRVGGFLGGADRSCHTGAPFLLLTYVVSV